MTRKYYLAQSARATPTGKFPFAVEAVFDSKEGLRQYLLSGKWKAGWSEDEIPALIDSLHVVAASGHINPGKHIPADKVVGWNRLADSQDPEIRALAGRPAKADDEQQTTAHGLDVDHVPATDRMHGRAWRHFVSTVETAPDRPSQTLSGGKALAATPFGDDALIPANATVDQYRRALRQVRDPAAIDFRDAYPDALDDLAKVPWR